MPAPMPQMGAMPGAQASPEAMARKRESTAMPRINERPGTSTAAQPSASVQTAMGMNPRILFWVAVAVMLLTTAAVVVHVLTR